MEKILQKIPFLRLTLALSCGIAAGNQIVFPYIPVLFITLLLFLVFTGFYLRYRYHHSVLFGTGIHVMIFLAGYMLFQKHNRHPVFFTGGKFMAVIREYPTIKPTTLQTKIEILAFLKDSEMVRTREVVVATFENREGPAELAPGETILFSKDPEMISNQGNPFEFDYRGYMEKSGVFRQVYLAKDEWIKGEPDYSCRISLRAERIRHKLLDIYREHNIADKQHMILSALTLGYKKELDQETKDTFAATGASHVLAVSGLHAGIIYFFLSFLLSPLRKTKTGNLLSTVIIIILLWTYALITGLSPSVCRSAAMLSFVITGKSLRRSIGIYNSLAASAFFLLVIQPNHLFNAGFQLSYAAVWSIVTFQPHMQKMITSKNRFIQYFWSLITVSAAAQAGTLPITLYYFNQFPTYFLISGIYIVPAVTLLIPSGLLLLLFSRIQFISGILVFVINKTLQGAIFLLEQTQMLPLAVIQPGLNKAEFVVMVFMVLLTTLVLKTKNIHHVVWLLVSILIFSSISAGTKIMGMTRNEVIIYNLPGPVIIHLIKGKKNYIVTENLPDNGSYAWKVIQTVVRRKNLDHPVYLDLKKTAKEPGILLKNGIVVFETKVILVNANEGDLPPGVIPDILIDPATKGNRGLLYHKKSEIVMSKRSNLYHLQPIRKIYHLKIDGAFQKKW